MKNWLKKYALLIPVLLWGGLLLAAGVTHAVNENEQTALCLIGAGVAMLLAVAFGAAVQRGSVAGGVMALAMGAVSAALYAIGSQQFGEDLSAIVTIIALAVLIVSVILGFVRTKKLRHEVAALEEEVYALRVHLASLRGEIAPDREEYKPRRHVLAAVLAVLLVAALGVGGYMLTQGGGMQTVHRTRPEQVHAAYDMGGIYEDRAWFVLEDGLHGYIDGQGNVAINAQYEKASSFSGGYATVVMGGKTGVIDREGNLVIACEWDYVSSSADQGRRCVKKDELYGMVDQTGKVIVPVEWEKSFSFSDGMAAVCREGKYGYINEVGDVVVEPRYTMAYSFAGGYAVVGTGKSYGSAKYGLIDKTGKEVIPCQWDTLAYCEENSSLYGVKGTTGPVQRMDVQGNVLATSFALNTKSAAGSVKKEINVLSTGISVQEGLVQVCMYNWETDYIRMHTECYLDATTLGLIIFPSDQAWSSAAAFKNGRAVVRTCKVKTAGDMDYDNQLYYGVINDQGRYVIQPKYEALYRVGMGELFKFKQNGLYGLLTANGSVAAAAAYDSISGLYNGRILVKKGANYGYLDANGKIAVTCKYEDANSFSENGVYTTAKYGGAWHVIDRSGNIVW